MTLQKQQMIKQGKTGGAQRIKKELLIREESAGGMVFKKTKRGIFFAMIKDSYGKWTFPKGHRELGEEKEETAARETLEELGLEEICFIQYIGKIDIWFQDRFVKKGKTIHKDINYFLFQTPEQAILHPQKQEGVQDAAWIPVSKLLQKSFYQDMVPIIKETLRFLNKEKI